MAKGTHHHPEYFIRGGDLYIRVEKSLFKVHSYFFTRESKYWKDELVGPVSPGDEPLKKGQDEKNAFVIEGEKPEDFARFLWVFYNNSFGNYSQSTEGDWRNILHFASKWEFPEVKDLAVRHLHGMDIEVVSRIRLYQANAVAEKHLFPLYVQLAKRNELIGLDEANALGMDTLVHVLQARERLRARFTKEPPFLSPVREGLSEKDISDIVASTFSITLT